MKNEIEVMFLNVKAGLKPMPITIDTNDLNAIKTLIGCDCFDIVHRAFGGKQYCVVCDDEALLKPKPLLSVFAHDPYSRIYDNVIIACEKGEDLASISPIDEIRIKSAVGTYTTDVTRYVLCTQT